MNEFKYPMNQKKPLFIFDSHLISGAFLLFGFCFLLSGCFPWAYKLDIPQGNIIEQEKVDQLKVGMTKRQVRYLLGTPLVADSFNQDRWQYYYSYKYYLPKDTVGSFYESKVVLQFEKGALVTIEKDIPKSDQEVQKEVQSRKADEIVVPEPGTQQ